MNKDKMKEIFEEESHELAYVVKNITDLPSQPGNYNISIENVRTTLPLFAQFDGEKWLNMEDNFSRARGDMSKISYFDKAPAKKMKP